MGCKGLEDPGLDSLRRGLRGSKQTVVGLRRLHCFRTSTTEGSLRETALIQLL